MWGALLALAAVASGEPPNILVLFADDMGYGDLSIQGHPTIETPNLDALAMGGVRFTQWYSAFHICSPSRAAMMTGRLPVRTGVSGDWTGGVFSSTAVGGLPSSEVTWAELLGRSGGYRTLCIGKWHLGQREAFLPRQRGFDEYLGIPYSVDMGQSAWRGDTTQPPLPLLANETVIEQPVDLNSLTDKYVTKARAFVSANETRRFALYMAFSHVHVPDFVSPRFCNTSARGRYGDAVAELDWAVGEIMRDLPSHTLTFFTSDNGPWLVEQTAGGSAGLFFEGKTTTFEGGIREPAILHWPGVIPAGQRRHALASTCDVFATILAVAGVDPPSDRILDGRDLMPAVLDQSVEVRDCLFIYKGRPSSSTTPGLWAVRCGRYKAHYVTSYSPASCEGSRNETDACNTPIFHDPPLLFDLDADPSEKWPLDPVAYADQLDALAAAKRLHELQLGTPPPDQIMLGSDPAFAVCGCPNSTLLYPSYPNCTCNPDNFQLAICAPLDLTHDDASRFFDPAAYADAFEADHGWRPF